ncbi:MAG: hypothetical protein IJ285_06490 [Clostridia bacterium]|nr:hypothetical protein [Clostridia bacterium]
MADFVIQLKRSRIPSITKTVAEKRATEKKISALNVIKEKIPAAKAITANMR